MPFIFLTICEMTSTNETATEATFKVLETAFNSRKGCVVVSLNVAATFHRKLGTPTAGPTWEESAPLIKRAVDAAHVILFQEVCQVQLEWIVNTFGGKFTILVLASTPADMPAGLYSNNSDEGLQGLISCKNLGAALVVTLVRDPENGIRTPLLTDIFSLSEVDWYKQQANDLPLDRGQTNKGFGNMMTIRGVLMVKTRFGCVFNTHFPISGGPKTRLACMDHLLRHAMMIHALEHEPIIIGGDMNLFTPPGDLSGVTAVEAHALLEHYGPILGGLVDISKTDVHEGSVATFCGFPCDTYQNPIVYTDKKGHAQFRDSERLDILAAPRELITSAQTTFLEIAPSSSGTRRFASDHAMLSVTLRDTVSMC
jgi:hypothetical protein